MRHEDEGKTWKAVCVVPDDPWLSGSVSCSHTVRTSHFAAFCHLSPSVAMGSNLRAQRSRPNGFLCSGVQMQSQARWRAQPVPQACPRRTAVNKEAACRKAAWQAQTGCHAALLRAPCPPRTACAAASWPLPGSQATPVHEDTNGTQSGAAGRAPELIVFTGPDGNEMFAVPSSEIAQVKDSLVHCATAYIAQAVVETVVVGTLHPTTCILWRPLVRSIQ